MRTKRAIINIVANFTLQLVAVALGFVVQRVFISTLGLEYNGLKTVLTNVVGVLGMAELGLGGLIIYQLYKPLAIKDENAVASLMHFYRKIYTAIGAIVLVAGLVCCLFVHLLIKDSPFSPGYIRISFLLFTVSNASSYLFSYRASLLYADQKNYISSGIAIATKIVSSLVYIYLIVSTKNFLVCTFSNLVFTMLNNVIIYIITSRLYPFLKNKPPLDSAIKKQLLNDAKQIAIGKLADTTIYQTDNIIIASFVGLVSVGMYANYNLIISSVSGFIASVFNAMIPSIGNLIVSEGDSSESTRQIFKAYALLCYFIASFCCICFFVLIPNFVVIWLGDAFLLPSSILLALCVVEYLTIATHPIWCFGHCMGLFKPLKWITIWNAVINMVVSLVLVINMGLVGVFIGTIASRLFSIIAHTVLLYRKTAIITEPLYVVKMLLATMLVPLVGAVTWWVCCLVESVSANLFITFMLQCMVCVLVANGLNLLFFCRTRSFSYLWNRFAKLGKG